MKCSRQYVACAVDHYGPSIAKIDPLLTKICAKNDFTFSFAVTLDL